MTSSQTATIKVLKTGLSSGSPKIAVTANGITTDYTSSFGVGPTSIFNGVKIGGNAFQLDGLNTATLGATATVTIHPTQTTFTLTDTTAGGSGSVTTSGEIAAGQQQSVSMNNGNTSVTFSVNSTLAAETSASYTTAVNELTTPGVGSSLPSSPTPATLAPADLAVATTGNAATGSNGVLTAQASAGSGAINIESVSNAQAALSVIDSAINTLSTERANVGAYQNRLNFASSNDQTSQQNLTSARAGIMDTNMALQMATLSKEQVLQQSGVAMLAQANAVPQALLKLLP
jgi:flagellin